MGIRDLHDHLRHRAILPPVAPRRVTNPDSHGGAALRRMVSADTSARELHHWPPELLTPDRPTTQGTARPSRSPSRSPSRTDYGRPMPYASSVVGFVVYAAVMLVFVVQEFTQGFGTPVGATERDDRWALVYLDAVPVVLVSISVGLTFAHLAPLPAPRTVYVAGLVVLALGVAVRQWSHLTLGRFHQGVVTVHDEHEVVTTGPYRWVRHPMYAGSAVAFLGVGLALGTWPGLALCFLGTLPAMLRRIHVEERVLRGSLGEAYGAYADGRKRLVPGVW